MNYLYRLPCWIHEYLDQILALSGDAVNQIVLIGSQANGTAHEKSDWDFLVFCDERQFIDMIRNSISNEQDIDLLIECGDDFCDPWSEKELSKEKLRLRLVDGRYCYRGAHKTEAKLEDKIGEIVWNRI